jgi:hypothetical protein
LCREAIGGLARSGAHQQPMSLLAIKRQLRPCFAVGTVFRAGADSTIGACKPDPAWDVVGREMLNGKNRPRTLFGTESA